MRGLKNLALALGVIAILFGIYGIRISKTPGGWWLIGMGVACLIWFALMFPIGRKILLGLSSPITDAFPLCFLIGGVFLSNKISEGWWFVLIGFILMILFVFVKNALNKMEHEELAKLIEEEHKKYHVQ